MMPPLGWIPFDERTLDQRDAHDIALRKMPAFAIIGDVMATPAVGTKQLLTDTWSHPSVVAKLGYAFPGWHQFTGSCVGVGGGNVEFTLAAIEILRKGDAEELIVPWWPLNYGRSRLGMGERGPGEGSLGSTFAQSCREDGVISAATPGLPGFFNTNGLTLGQDEKTAGRMEMTWSDGTRISNDLLSESRKHLVHTTAELHSAGDVRDAILNGYPVTRAFGKFCNPGEAKVQGDALVGNYNGRGGHQEAWLGYWNHPQLGELIWEQNTWGKTVYGSDPSGGPGGGCWQKFADVDRMCRSGDAEIFAFSQFDGYPAQQLDYLLF